MIFCKSCNLFSNSFIKAESMTVHRNVFSQYIRMHSVICHYLSQRYTVPSLCPGFSSDSANHAPMCGCCWAMGVCPGPGWANWWEEPLPWWCGVAGGCRMDRARLQADEGWTYLFFFFLEKYCPTCQVSLYIWGKYIILDNVSDMFNTSDTDMFSIMMHFPAIEKWYMILLKAAIKDKSMAWQNKNQL